MKRTLSPWHFDLRLLRDFVVAFLAFLGLALAVSSTSEPVTPWIDHGLHASFAEAQPMTPPDGPASGTVVSRIETNHDIWSAFEPPPTLAVILVLAAMFAAFVTFNLAVVRHLRCVSASPRRRSWREG